MSIPRDFEGLRPANVESENARLKEHLVKEYGMMDGQRSAELDPELENAFLRYILEFEKSYKDCKRITVFEKIGSPYFIKESEIEKKYLHKEINRLFHLLDKHNIIVDFCDGPYPDEDVYHFLTEDLMRQEVEDVQMENLNCHFIYEEFYPNHKADISRLGADFIECWINRKFTAEKPSLSEFLLSPSGNRFTQQKLSSKLEVFFNAYSQFEIRELEIEHVEFELSELGYHDVTGLGFIEGRIEYLGRLDIGDSQLFKGKFKIFVCKKCNWWSVNCFLIPGFSWET